jgi:hypothetical protein
MIKIWWFIKCLFGFGSVEDGSICWFSSGVPWLFDVHDYPKDKGGDDIPCCFHEYECHKCGKKFGI